MRRVNSPVGGSYRHPETGKEVSFGPGIVEMPDEIADAYVVQPRRLPKDPITGKPLRWTFADDLDAKPTPPARVKKKSRAADKAEKE